jgi:hypothetical protein
LFRHALADGWRVSAFPEVATGIEEGEGSSNK